MRRPYVKNPQLIAVFGLGSDTAARTRRSRQSITPRNRLVSSTYDGGPSALAESKRTERFWPLVVTYIAAPEGGEQPSPTASERGSGRVEETACFDQFLQTTRFDTNKPNSERLELKSIPRTSSLTFVPDMFKFWDLKTFLITLFQLP